MELGLAAWGLRELPIQKQLALAKKLGVKYVEFSIANYDKDALQLSPSKADIENIRKLYKKYGISLDCACTGNDFTGPDVKKQVAKVKNVIATAAALGVKYLRVFAGFNSDSVVTGKRYEAMLDALKQVNACASAAGVEIVIETHGGVASVGPQALVHFASTTTRVDSWKRILETGVSMCYDPANLAAAGVADPVAFYRQFKKAIRYVHLKDFRDVPGGVWPAACGEGRLDWKKLLAALKSYNGPALIEYELPDDVADGMKRSIDFLKA
ncbi:MAG: sugar phosphate isomerase/epimerase [Victivallales bacterium]|nr:sugar phosphate isomerase/epimerase [Victivallales bacterium]